MEPWGGFFIAQVGASAALAGLIFVAVSLNLAKVVASSHLPTRLQGANGAHGNSHRLVARPRAQPLVWFGGEAILISLPIWIIVIAFDVRTLAVADKAYRRRSMQRLALSQLAAGLFVIGAIAMLAFGFAGVYG